MSDLAYKGNPLGTGTITLETPNTNTDRTLTLPDSDATLSTVSSIGDLSNATTTGTFNLALGSTALSSRTTGNYNTGVGDASMTGVTSGNYNTAIGYNTLRDTTTQSSNTALGFEALRNNTAANNTAVGMEACLLNTTGANNVAVGIKALRANTTGYENVGVGQKALTSMTTGYGNTGCGDNALRTCSTGHQNTAVGNDALWSVTTGYHNTAIGQGALETLTTGVNNAGIGTGAVPSSAGVYNEFTLGNSSVNNLRCYDTTISSPSDQRDKAEITDLPTSAGLNLINKLRPVTYYWDDRQWYEDGVSDGSKVTRDVNPEVARSGQKMGFIAQEVEATIAGTKCLEDSLIITGTDEKKEFAMAHFITPLVKAVQELSKENEELKARVTILEGGA